MTRRRKGEERAPRSVPALRAMLDRVWPLFERIGPDPLTRIGEAMESNGLAVAPADRSDPGACRSAVAEALAKGLGI